jgi:hypothetical protein
MLKPFLAREWCFDPYAKQCERCDTIIGRYAVMLDDVGLRQVMFWPFASWDGSDGSFRCRSHSKIAQQWTTLF